MTGCSCEEMPQCKDKAQVCSLGNWMAKNAGDREYLTLRHS